MLDRMHLLIRFQAIATAGSVRKAAETLNITQPALSRSLAQLEEMYGQPLLDRHARGVRPTAFGQRLLSTVSRIARDLELAEYQLASPDVTVEGRLVLSAGPLWAAVTLPVVIGRLQAIYPNLSVEITLQSGEPVVPALLEGRIDASFGGLHSRDREFKHLQERRLTFVHDRVVARAGHPIHSAAPDDYGALHDYPWITYTADPIYEAETLHTVVERTGRPPQIRVRTTSLLAALRLLQEHDYLCVLPDAAVTGLPGMPVAPTPIDMGRRMGPSGALFRPAMLDYLPFQTLLELCADFFATADGHRPPHHDT